MTNLPNKSVPTAPQRGKGTSKSFRDWKLQDLHKTFGLKRDPNVSPLLAELLLVPNLNDPALQQSLSHLALKLQNNEDAWNEEELKMFFIAFLLDLVAFKGETYRVFMERAQSATIGNVEMNGIVDAIVATGFQEPEQPFFFLHEYKPESPKSSNDPKGQLLAAMLAAQAQNEDKNLPIYGCYVLGRFWFFTVLKDKTYSFSGAYDATKQEDIQAVYQILQKIKGKIEGYLVQKFGIA